MPDLKPGYNLIRRIGTHARHCEERSDEAIQSHKTRLDCFALLAIAAADKESTDV
jgi:hypothetical protein